MFYPHKKIFSVSIRLTKKQKGKDIVFLEIPQATIGERSEISMLSPSEQEKYFINKLREWGAGDRSIEIYKSLGKNFLEILKPHFFYSYNLEMMPESVKNLAEKEKYKYSVPESTIFMTIYKEYGIKPRELLDYTMDELQYLVNALQYKNLNDEQKAELQRIEIKKQMDADKEELDKQFALLHNTFQQGEQQESI